MAIEKLEYNSDYLFNFESLEKTNEIIDGLEGVIGNHISSTYPIGFNWPLAGGVWDTFKAVKNGDSYECSVAPEDLIDFTQFINTIYVDRNAPDAQDGTSWATAENRIGQAIDAANASGQPTKILVKGGVYERAASICNDSMTKNVNVPIAIIAQYGRVKSGNFDILTYTQNATYSNVYEAARSNVNYAVDPSRTLSNGSYLRYKLVSSLLECSQTADSWYTDNVNVYINNSQSIVTNENARLYLNVPAGALSTNSDMYFYGVDFESGNTGAINPKNGNTNTVVIDNCTCRYAINGTAYNGALQPRDGATILGCGLFAAFNSDASFNSKDGFNLHEEGATLPPMLTVNCTGRYNGEIISTSQSNNGITVHDGCKTIDIGGQWEGNIGTNAGHINDNTQVWHFGSTVSSSDGDVYNGGGINWGGFGAWVGSCEVFLEYCRDEACDIGVYAGASSTVRIKEHSGTGTRSGNIQPFAG